MLIMELLTGALLALGGGALLLQSKALPSDADAAKAKEVLDRSPLDPTANTTFGKYTAFVQGDYSAAMSYLVNSGDKTFKILAEHELDASYTASPPQKVGMGDEWVIAAKKFPALNKIFYDRASQWYGLAWPDLVGVWKDRTREQLRKLHQNVSVPDPKTISAPSGWKTNDLTQKGGATTKAARTGKVSYQVAAVKNAPAFSTAAEQTVNATPGKTYDFSVWALPDGTDGAEDQITLAIYVQGAVPVDVKRLMIPMDEPWWHRVEKQIEVPNNATTLRVMITATSRVGNLFVDDISLKVDGKEQIKNGSFEDK